MASCAAAIERCKKSLAVGGHSTGELYSPPAKALRILDGVSNCPPYKLIMRLMSREQSLAAPPNFRNNISFYAVWPGLYPVRTREEGLFVAVNLGPLYAYIIMLLRDPYYFHIFSSLQ